MISEEYFVQLQFDDHYGFPRGDSPVHQTSTGVPYLVHPGIELEEKIVCNPDALSLFLRGFPKELGFADYSSDSPLLPDGTPIPDSSRALRIAGPLCYMSFGPHRTKNRESEKYINHLKEMGHWSVFRHAVFAFTFWGVSRSLTHELVRHDFIEPSQTSQRYTTKETLRFVERPEYQEHPSLHDFFINHVNQLAQSYSDLEDLMRKIQQEDPYLKTGSRTQTKKNCQQAARGILSNVVEAPIYVTANANAWRHFIDVRATKGADPEIRKLALMTLAVLAHVDPLIFGDYRIQQDEDGDYIAVSPYPSA